MNIFAHISAISGILVKRLAFIPKGIDSIRKLKNVLITKSLQPLLMADIYYILEAIILPNTMIEFGLKL